MDFSLESLSLFLKEYQYRFIRFAANYTDDTSVAEDFFMESVMAFWQNRSNLPQSTNVPAYILTSLKNKCLNYLRHLATTEEYMKESSKLAYWDVSTRVASLESFIPEEVFSKEITTIVMKTLKDVSEQSRDVFLLSRRDGKSNKDIAELLNISEKGVEYHITKVNKLLREALKDYLTVFVILFYLL